MDFEPTDRILELEAREDTFMQEHIYPRELDLWHFVDDDANRWQYPPWFEGLKQKARDAGIWNWFLHKEYEEFSPGLASTDLKV